MRALLLFGTLASTAYLAAQVQPGQLGTTPPEQSERDRAVSTTNTTYQPTYQPLTVGEKYRVALHRTFGPDEFLRMTLGAGIDQWRDHPHEWGEGWDSYGVRVASHFGQHLIKEQMEFAVRAIDHEDPRHELSGLSGFWPRTRFAVVHTFVARNDNGSWMPAYSKFVGAYGSGFISRQWFPDRFHTFPAGVEAGSAALGIDAGMNVLREFWPDIRHRVLHR